MVRPLPPRPVSLIFDRVPGDRRSAVARRLHSFAERCHHVRPRPMLRFADRVGHAHVHPVRKNAPVRDRRCRDSRQIRTPRCFAL
jgi:hypothetical protein